jgi:hypothetical protein
MRPIAMLLVCGLFVASIAACAPISDNQKIALATTCPQLEGYPDCPSQDTGATLELATTQSPTR